MIIESVPDEERAKYGSPLIEGFNNLNFELTHVRKLLDKHCLKGMYVTGVGKTEWYDVNWKEQSIAEKKDIINGVDLVFTASGEAEHANRVYASTITSNPP